LKRRQAKKIATNPRLWRRLVSANFLVGINGETMTNYRMIALGVPVARIARMHENLPLVGVPR
jgi:hypothetical protein